MTISAEMEQGVVRYRKMLIEGLENEMKEACKKLDSLEKECICLDHAVDDRNAEIKERFILTFVNRYLEESVSFDELDLEILERRFDTLNDQMLQIVRESNKDQDVAKALAITKSQIKDLKLKKARVREEEGEQKEILKHALQFLVNTVTALTEFCTMFFGFWDFCKSRVLSWIVFLVCLCQIWAITLSTHSKLRHCKAMVHRLNEENGRLRENLTELVNGMSEECRKNIDKEAPSHFPIVGELEVSIRQRLSLKEKLITHYQWTIWTPAVVLTVLSVGMAIFTHYNCGKKHGKKHGVESVWTIVRYGSRLITRPSPLIQSYQPS